MLAAAADLANVESDPRDVEDDELDEFVGQIDATELADVADDDS